MPWNNIQLERLGDGLNPDLTLTGVDALAAFIDLENANLAALMEHRAAPRSNGDAA
ncbi:hypothetical protein QN239_02790 [Mycolicibacterium sp. Y3]